jgi:hypothetical protein
MRGRPSHAAASRGCGVFGGAFGSVFAGVFGGALRWQGDARDLASGATLRQVHDADKGGSEHCLILVAAAFCALARCA